jgi:hypothetical protein
MKEIAGRSSFLFMFNAFSDWKRIVSKQAIASVELREDSFLHPVDTPLFRPFSLKR